MAKRTSTTKVIALLRQLYLEGQLKLATEFQRNSVWPSPAKAYLIDTILNDKPIPILFFQRATSAQTGRMIYVVIDGQQRLRAIFEFLDDRFRLTQSKKSQPYFRKTFSGLPTTLQNQILNYDLIIEEVSGYSEKDIEDMFVRMNRYVVTLSRQELRHAREKGAFKDFVEQLGKLDFWKTNRVFSPLQIRRMRAVEFSAELAILLIEGPQDKKKAIDLYYQQYRVKAPFRKSVEARIKTYLRWIRNALPDLHLPKAKHRFRKSVDLYSLIGALEEITKQGKTLSKLVPKVSGQRLREFEKQLRQRQPTGEAARYLLAASRQTDNIGPRTTRISVLANLLRR